MTALTDLSRRIERLERRQRKAPRSPATLPLPTPEQMRTVLKMAIEAGALINPEPGSPFWRLRELLRNQPDYEQEDDSNATAGTGDPTGPLAGAAQRMGA